MSSVQGSAGFIERDVWSDYRDKVPGMYVSSASQSIVELEPSGEPEQLPTRDVVRRQERGLDVPKPKRLHRRALQEEVAGERAHVCAIVDEELDGSFTSEHGAPCHAHLPPRSEKSSTSSPRSPQAARR